ncbi:hypothetical protein [Mesorhizobium sp. 128a]
MTDRRSSFDGARGCPFLAERNESDDSQALANVQTILPEGGAANSIGMEKLPTSLVSCMVDVTSSEGLLYEAPTVILTPANTESELHVWALKLREEPPSARSRAQSYRPATMDNHHHCSSLVSRS